MELSELGRAALDYVSRGLAVIPLKQRSKTPATKHGCSDWTDDPDTVAEWWSAHPNSNIGIVCGAPSGNLAVLDVDVDGEADGNESLRALERACGELPETVSAVTGRGGSHYLFRSAEPVRPCVNPDLHIDVRGEGSYIVAPPSVHPNGRRYEWEVPPGEAEIAPLEGSAKAVFDAARPTGGGAAGDAPWNVFEPVERQAEGGRNEYLFRMASSMQAKSFPDDVIRAAVMEANRTTCVPPLPDWEAETVVKSALRRAKGRSRAFEGAVKGNRPHDAPANPADGAKQPADNGRKAAQSRVRFKHNDVAKKLMEERGACFVDGVPAIREGGRYATGWDAIDAAIIDMHDDCTAANRKEVKLYIQAKAPRKDQSPPDLIAFRNGVLDVGTLELRPMAEDDVIPNVVPHDWDPAAECPEVDAILERISCGSIEVQMNLTEVIGLCIYRDASRYPFVPVLLGGGSNGKSTFVNLLRWTVGEENVSSMQPSEIAKRFQAVNVVGKTANLGDDIAGGYLDGDACAVIKKVATGDVLNTDVKGTVGFDFRPYCTMVFSANAFPRLADTSYGMMRRLFPIEFRARFSRSDASFDPRIGERLKTEEAAMRALVLGVEALRRMAETNEMTPNDASRRIAGEIMSTSSTVLQWLNDLADEGGTVEGRTKIDAYGDYSEWCEANGYRATRVGSGTFSAQVGTFTGMTLCQFARNSLGKRVRVYALPE